MGEWCADGHQPLFITGGEGPYLIDAAGRRYIDGNASIWTNIHGHGHPALIRAIQEQAATLAHCSSLGFANVPAANLAAALCGLFPKDTLTRVFYTDDGSTAIECALRMALQFWQMQGEDRTKFLAFDGAYHGDTLGAASLGGIPTFHRRLAGLGVPVLAVPDMESAKDLPEETRSELAGVVIEPLIQGAAGMRLWPQGMLGELREWCDRNRLFLILDEVMTGFGRTGKMFACEHEGVIPDFIALAKGLTGGTLPLAATLTTERVFEAFFSQPGEQRTFFYGHSYSGNPLGCAAALATLKVFEDKQVLESLEPKIALLGSLLNEWKAADPRVLDVRQCGFIAGIEIGSTEGNSLPVEERTGAAVCLAARRHGLLTRPINDTLVLMPPLCIMPEAIRETIAALKTGLDEIVA